MRDYSNLRLASVQISYELDNVDGVYKARYDEIYTSKILAILQHLKGNADVVVFPELSIPFELLQYLKECVPNYPAMIIAGSHYIESKNLENYNSLFPNHTFQDGDIRKNICPIILPDGTMHHIEKINPSRDEDVGFNSLGMTKGNIQSIFKVGNYNVGIMICSDFLNPVLKERIVSKSHLLIVPQYNYNMERFYAFAQSDFSNPNNYLRGIFLSNANNNLKSDETKKKIGGSAFFRDLNRKEQKWLQSEYKYVYQNAALITNTEEEIVIVAKINLNNSLGPTPNVWSEAAHPLDYRLIPIIQKNEELSKFTMLLEETAYREKSCVELNNENRDFIKASSQLLFNKTQSLVNMKPDEIKNRFEMILY